MLKNTNLLLPVVTTLIGCASSAPAFADAPVFKDPNVANHFYHDRLRLQVIDGSPIMSDTRHPVQQGTYVVQVGPMPTPASAEPIVVRPSTNAPGIVNVPSSNSRPGGFESNMSSLRPAPMRSLPNGYSTNSGIAKLLPHATPSQSAVQAPTVLASNPQGKPVGTQAKPVIKQYASDSASGSSGFNSKQDVFGSIRKRGDLLSVSH